MSSGSILGRRLLDAIADAKGPEERTVRVKDLVVFEEGVKKNAHALKAHIESMSEEGFGQSVQVVAKEQLRLERELELQRAHIEDLKKAAEKGTLSREDFQEELDSLAKKTKEFEAQVGEVSVIVKYMDERTKKTSGEKPPPKE